MKYALAAIGSVTTAVRLRKAVAISGVAVVHTPSVINKGGCSYSLKFREELTEKVVKSAKSSNIEIKGLYIEEINGGEREYRALS